jgi:hypothetical protein
MSSSPGYGYGGAAYGVIPYGVPHLAPSPPSPPVQQGAARAILLAAVAEGTIT